MSDIAIRVENLSKLYYIGGKQERYRTLRDTLTNAAMTPVRAAHSLFGRNGPARRGQEAFWALRDVSFEVKRGEVVGIIGRNGAGKSTLLKVLSRITEPTEGHAELHGRVASLLEVGTGFHPELSGRENIYLNGAILGMKRSEIERKFDEIVAFAEVEKFIDTPVKHYSSGMYLRLAFGVAAHLEPEILVVDEVLAVGDAVFQKKCLGKMDEVAKQGRTVLFVSHNMEAVLSLCSRSLVLSHGCLAYEGVSEEAVRFYHQSALGRAMKSEAHILEAPHSQRTDCAAYIAKIEILDVLGKPKSALYTWDDLLLRIHYAAAEDMQSGAVILDIRDFKDQRLIVLDSGECAPLRQGSHFIDCYIPCLPLAAGEYYLGGGLAMSRNQWLWRETNLGELLINGRDVFNIGRPPTLSRMIFAVPHEWRISASPLDHSMAEIPISEKV